MRWDSGPQTPAVLAAISLGLSVFACLVVDGGVGRARSLASPASAPGGISEGLFGWASESGTPAEHRRVPHDETLLSSVLTPAVVVLVTRHLARRTSLEWPGDRHLIGRRHGRPARHRKPTHTQG